MSKVYEQYFGGKEVSYGKSSMMQDISKHRLSGKELAALIDDLEAKGLLLDKPFTPKPKAHWDKNYLDRLSNGHIADYFSRAYLEHFGEAADYVYRRERRNKAKAIVAALVLAGASVLAWRYFTSPKGQPPERPQSAQMEFIHSAPAPGVSAEHRGVPSRTACAEALPAALAQSGQEGVGIQGGYRNERS